MIREKQNKEMIIDLTGPEGNAFCLLGYAKSFAKHLSYSKEEIEELISDMMNGDYEHLVTVFDSHFGHFVILER
jgi:hypothetical protein